MPQAAAIPLPRPGRTFKVAVALLAALGLVLTLAAAWALVRHLNLPAALPAKPAAEPRAGSPRVAPTGDGLAADRRAPGSVPELLDGNLVAPASAAPVPIDVPPASRPGAIQDLELLEMVEVAAALRQSGDTAAALKKLREADARLPLQPRVLWELGQTLNALGLSEKRAVELEKIRQLGAERAGEYFQLASLALDSQSGAADLIPRQELGFGQSVISPVDDAAGGERVVVRLELHSNVDRPVAPGDVAMIMEFYDLVDGSRIEETRSNEPVSRWLTIPIDWAEAGSEIVEWEYYMPRLDAREREAFGERRYYGFVARLYYHDALQDVYAVPRTLLARPQGGGPAPMLDDSLFPPGS